MVSLTLVAALLLPVILNVQYGKSAGAPVSVQVGAEGRLVYNPSSFNASNGTEVTFIIPTGELALSATQGSFENPCTYLNGSGGVGFDSGLQNGSQFTIQITNDRETIWFFCKNMDHCGLGMVGAINAPTSGNTFEAYLAAAMTLGQSEPAIPQGGPVTNGVGAVATSTPVPTSSASSASHLVADGSLALLAVAFGITLA